MLRFPVGADTKYCGPSATVLRAFCIQGFFSHRSFLHAGLSVRICAPGIAPEAEPRWRRAARRKRSDVHIMFSMPPSSDFSRGPLRGRAGAQPVTVSRSAIHSLMSDCRGTPRNRASRSRAPYGVGTTQAGKSTLTRLGSGLTRRACAQSTCPLTSSPASNARSNALAFSPGAFGSAAFVALDLLPAGAADRRITLPAGRACGEDRSPRRARPRPCRPRWLGARDRAAESPAGWRTRSRIRTQGHEAGNETA